MKKMDSSIELNFNLPLIQFQDHQFQDQILEQFECAMPETESKRWEKMRERERKRRESLTPYNRILRAGEKVRAPT